MHPAVKKADTLIRPHYSPEVAYGHAPREFTPPKPSDTKVRFAAQSVLRGSSPDVVSRVQALSLDNTDLSKLAEKIKGMLPENALIIPDELVKKVYSSLKGDEKKNFLLALATIAKSYAVTETKTSSNYECPVTYNPRGAAAIGRSGTLYLAFNIEFKNCLPSAYIHPLAFLVSTLRAHGEENVLALAFSEELSGQEIDLFNAISWGPDCKVVMGVHEPTIAPNAIDKRKFLQFPAGTTIHDLKPDELEGDLEKFAFGSAQAAAHDSFSCLTDSKFGVVIVRDDGRVYPGSYLEIPNSYTTFGPLQGAIAAYRSEGNSYDRIKTIMVAEQMPKYSAAPQKQEIELIVEQLTTNEIIVHIEEF